MSREFQPYEGNGVIISKTPLKSGDEVTLVYEGLLAKSGADKVYAYVGYGEAWDESGFIPMEGNDGSFRTTFEVIGKDSLNISFKDSADNWDNNSSNNYIYKLAKTVRRSAKISDKTAVKESQSAAAKTSVKSRTKSSKEKKGDEAAPAKRKAKKQSKEA